MVRGYGNVVFYGSACGAGLVNRGAGSVGFHSFCLVCGRVRVAVAGGMPPWCGIGGFVARGSGLCAPVGWSGVVSGYGGIRPAVVAVGVTVLHDGMQGLCCGAVPAGTRGRGVARRARPSHAP